MDFPSWASSSSRNIVTIQILNCCLQHAIYYIGQSNVDLFMRESISLILYTFRIKSCWCPSIYLYYQVDVYLIQICVTGHENP